MSQKEVDQKFVQMTQTPVEKIIVRLAIPSVISMLITTVYNAADTFFIGQISTSASAAVGVCFSVMSIIQALGFFFGQGAGSTISRALGNQQSESAGEMAAVGFFSSIGCGILVAVLGLTFMKPLVYLLGATDTIYPHAVEYLSIILIGAPIMGSSFVLNNLLRFQGYSFYGMIGVTVGGVLNMLLDPLFIFVFQLGTAGAALATVVSQGVSLVILFYLNNRHSSVKIKVRNLSPRARHYADIVRGGLPSLLRQGLASLALIFLNLTAKPYGDAAIAAMSVVGRVSFFVYAAVIGLGQGFQPLCGFCYGAGRYGRVRAGFVFCVSAGTALLTGCAVVCWCCAEGIVALFRADPAVVAVGAEAFRWQILAWPLLAFTGVANQMLQTLRLAWRANLVAAARSGLFFLPLALVLPAAFGLRGVELIQPVSDVCAFLLALPVVLFTFRQMVRR